jgi:hypothetical protein
MDLLFFSNGIGIALGARHKNLVEMAATHWGTRFDSENLFVEVLVKSNETEEKVDSEPEEAALEVVEEEEES